VGSLVHVREVPSRRSGGPDRAGLAELMTTRPALTGLLACRRGASHRSHVATTGESRKLLRRYHRGFGFCVLFALHSLVQGVSFIRG
jgi:hypothetical protein